MKMRASTSGIKRHKTHMYSYFFPFVGAKTLDAFNPALCELFGHLVVKSKWSSESFLYTIILCKLLKYLI